MRHILHRVLEAALILGLAGPAGASELYYSFGFSGDGVAGSGDLLLSGAPDPAAPLAGGYDILGITGTLDGAPITGLLGTTGAAAYSPDGFFIYDNDFYIAGDAAAPGAYFDDDGLLFTTADDSYNLYFDGSNYILYGDRGWGTDVSFAAADPPPPAVPEPASLALMATALVGLGLLKRRRAQRG